LRLIANVKKDTQSHLYELKQLLSTSEQIVICSGWMKGNGLSLLLKDIRKAIRRGSEITVYTNQEHTEPGCIKSLLKMPGLKHFNVPKPIYLHSKIYYGQKDDSYSAIIGSANITKGGLCTNEELSYLVSGKIGDDAHGQLALYLGRLSELESTSSIG
jgi:HKD family nuclease